MMRENRCLPISPTEGNLHIYAWIIAGTMALCSTLLSLYLIYKHFRNYTNPNLQRYIVRILLMVPIYSIDSFLSLIFKEYALYFDILRDCYEAYVLWLFFTLLLNYLKGTEQVEEIMEDKPPMKHPFPTCFFPKFKPGKRFLAWCKMCILQFALIKPLDTVIAIILYRPCNVDADLYADGDLSAVNRGYLWITVIDNISITISMYFLVLFGKAVNDELKPFKPVPKFLCIKAVIFFSFWQGVVIAILASDFVGLIKDNGSWTKDQVATGLQDFIICIEMFGVAIAHIKVFGYEEFRNPEKTPFIKAILAGKVKETTVPLLHSFADTINPKHDVKETISTLNEAPIFKIKSPWEKRKEESHTVVVTKAENEISVQVTDTYTETVSKKSSSDFSDDV